MSKSSFLVVKNGVIEKIIKSTGNQDILAEYKNKIDVKIYQWHSFIGQVPPKLKIGDSFIPKGYEWSLIKRVGKIPKPNKRKYGWDKFDLKEEYITKWFSTLTKEKVDSVKSITKKVVGNKDLYYRAYHHSFKMYWMRDASMELYQALNYLIGQEDKLEIKEASELMKYNFLYSFVLQKNMERVKDIEFVTYCNEQNLWTQDAINLMGSMMLLQQTIESFVKFSEDFLNKEGLLFREDRTLRDYEALVIDCYNPLSNLRGLREDANKIEELIKSYAKN